MGLADLLKKADESRLQKIAGFTDALIDNQSVIDCLNGFLQEKDFILSEEIIKKLHTLLCDETEQEAAGVYREESEELNRYIQHYLGQLELAKRFNHPIEFATIAHKRFLDVHPFAEKNEEIAWLLLNLWLMQSGYAAIGREIVDSVQYESALAQARNPQCPDPDALISVVAQAVIKEQT